MDGRLVKGAVYIVVQQKSLMEKTWLSPTSLNLFLDCRRCFWLQAVKGLSRPRIMPSLPTGVDSVLKEHFAKYRGSLPPILAGRVEGTLPRDMPKSLSFDFGFAGLRGYPDEYLMLTDGSIVPMDHKTRASAPTEVHPSYQLQMNCYGFLLEKNGYKTKRLAYLLYYYPESLAENELKMGIVVKEIQTDTSRIPDLVKAASKTLKLDIPMQSKDCKFCDWAKTSSQ